MTENKWLAYVNKERKKHPHESLRTILKRCKKTYHKK